MKKTRKVFQLDLFGGEVPVILGSKPKKKTSQREEFFRILSDPISTTCRRTHMQICHLCEREDCCDNTNPLVVKIKKLEKEIELTHMDKAGESI